MRVIISRQDELAREGADAVEQVLRSRPRPVIGLATGSSPLPIYAELVRRHLHEGLSFATAEAFLLDEYVGLAADHPERYMHVIERELVCHVDLDMTRVHSLDGLAADLDAVAATFEERLATAGGVDVQILGIGSDGHIAFNEPGSPFTSRTRAMLLTEQTRRDNARFFGGDIGSVPQLCLTQGLGTIMAARRIVLIATGAGKAEAVQQLVEGEVSVDWPATVLQQHADVTVLLDEAAASRLEHAESYRQVEAL